MQAIELSGRVASIVALTCGLALASACGDDSPEPVAPAIANPASEFCVEQGGEIDIVDEDDGQVGYCVLPDGTRIDEWTYFREQNPSP